jgi:hypothetical protein
VLEGDNSFFISSRGDLAFFYASSTADDPIKAATFD